MGKRNYHLVIDEKTIKAFKQYIMNKTGDFKKGDLSKWFEIIIKNSIREDLHQQHHSAYNRHGMSKEEEMISILTELMKDISSYFWKLETPFPFRCGVDIHKKVLRTGISAIRGHDYRTTKKWIERLLEFGFIRKAANNQYKILNDGHESYDVKQDHKEEFDTVMEGLK